MAIPTSVAHAKPPRAMTRQLHHGPWIQGSKLTHEVNFVASEESESSSRRQARASMAKYVGERAGSTALRQVGHVERERSSDSRVEIRGEALKVLVQFGEAYNAWTGELHVGTENTVGELKKRLSQIHHIPVKLQMLRLKCTKGNTLDVDETTLREAGVRNGDRLLLAGRQSWYPTMAPPEESAREELLKYEDFEKRMDPVGFWANENVGTDPDSR